MTQFRKESLTNNQYYHIFNRSIAGYEIFSSPHEFQRMFELIKLYRFKNFNYKYSQFSELELSNRMRLIEKFELQNDVLVEIISYCIMPTHIHLLLKQTTDNGITKYLSKILNGYARYFNTKHNRIGPLWAGRFKNVLVQNDDQLLHLTRYIHLNPTSANLIEKPQDWQFSSYKEYIAPDNSANQLCQYKNIINLTGSQYKIFVNDQKSYQHELALIKHLIIEDYTG